MFSGNGDSGDTVATISATRIFITQLCADMNKSPCRNGHELERISGEMR